ncbi:class I SAM-dependent methyltransferase [Bacillus chungangensis]|uniref:SAM-dependent methyltransferase n=1 Tax=Bacillus chungangensis TaxID=587633 RepID=A0ABT9WUK1_9BACI|nr:methyltransferase domain-containing protein [Bacillus chungangensis]MDQ0176567.1 SAM-dependent methyltransferase [Bacillus chungangensis]
MKTTELFDMFLKQEDEPFSGWDFSFIGSTGRVQNSLLPWSYCSKVLPMMKSAETMLDMGTGGGELLSKLRPFPAKTYATEGYEPNIKIAQQTLEPLGVKVKSFKDDDSLPFSNHQFDLIINKHESYSEKEIFRILKSGGMFLTQQVGGFDCLEINEILQAPIQQEYLDWNLENAARKLKDNGFNILETDEAFPTQRFFDVGALIYYLKAIPWQIEDFSVSAYRDQLFQVHQMIEKNGFIDVKQHRFLLVATPQ